MSDTERDAVRELTTESGNVDIIHDFDVGDLLRMFLDCLFLPLFSHCLGGPYRLSPGRLQLTYNWPPTSVFAFFPTAVHTEAHLILAIVATPLKSLS